MLTISLSWMGGNWPMNVQYNSQIELKSAFWITIGMGMDWFSRGLQFQKRWTTTNYRGHACQAWTF